MSAESTSGIDKFLRHLEFGGYKFEPLGEAKDLWLGRHPEKPKVAIREVNQVILFSALYSPKNGVTAETPGLFAWVNRANIDSLTGRFFFHNGAFWAETWWFGEYDKAVFDRLFDRWLAEIARFFEAHEQIGKQFLE